MTMVSTDDITLQLLKLLEHENADIKTDDSILQQLEELYSYPLTTQALLDQALLICAYHFPAYVPFFLDHGADPNTQDDHHMNALQAIIERDGLLIDENVILPVIKKLIAKGAILDHLDNKQCTALYYAIDSNYCQIARYLLEQGSQVNLRANGDSLFVIALAKFEEIMNLKTTGTEDDVRQQPIWKNPTAMVDLLLEYQVETLDILFSMQEEWYHYQSIKKSQEPVFLCIKYDRAPHLFAIKASNAHNCDQNKNPVGHDF
jgi:hypothetical protein